MNVGILGIFQNYQGRSSDAEMMRAEMGVAELAEPLGFDSYWPPEHHFTDYSGAKATLAPSGGDRPRAWPPSP
jgi:alkanesulfonate monooxygenase SsuD/methylene tetrahydromethanopterin reductase-like flavin-dependent oxidoreductase (luciferase family)